MNETSSAVGLINGLGDETGGEETSAGSVNVGSVTESNSVLFRVSDSIDILLTAVVGLVTGRSR